VSPQDRSAGVADSRMNHGWRGSFCKIRSFRGSLAVVRRPCRRASPGIRILAQPGREHASRLDEDQVVKPGEGLLRRVARVAGGGLRLTPPTRRPRPRTRAARPPRRRRPRPSTRTNRLPTAQRHGTRDAAGRGHRQGLFGKRLAVLHDSGVTAIQRQPTVGRGAADRRAAVPFNPSRGSGLALPRGRVELTDRQLPQLGVTLLEPRALDLNLGRNGMLVVEAAEVATSQSVVGFGSRSRASCPQVNWLNGVLALNESMT